MSLYNEYKVHSLEPLSGIVESLAVPGTDQQGSALDRSLQCAMTRTEENSILIKAAIVKVKEIMKLRGYSDSMVARLIGFDITTFMRITRTPKGTNRPSIDKMQFFIDGETKAKSDARLMLSHKLGLNLRSFGPVLKDFIKFREAVEEVASKIRLGKTVHDRNILFYLEKLTTTNEHND